jgi:hypothetical protein
MEHTIIQTSIFRNYTILMRNLKINLKFEEEKHKLASTKSFGHYRHLRNCASTDLAGTTALACPNVTTPLLKLI